jgi:hypothetical protein
MSGNPSVEASRFASRFCDRRLLHTNQTTIPITEATPSNVPTTTFPIRLDRAAAASEEGVVLNGGSEEAEMDADGVEDEVANLELVGEAITVDSVRSAGMRGACQSHFQPMIGGPTRVFLC